MELKKINKVRSIKLPKKLIDTIDIVEIKPKAKTKTNLKNDPPVSIIKPQIKENNTLVIIETGPFLIQL
jgi:hypothetical protein